MKILIVSSYEPVPRLERRVNLYKRCNAECNLIYLNRSGDTSKDKYSHLGIRIFEFSRKIRHGDYFKRLFAYKHFRNFIKKILDNDYDFIHIQDLDMFLLLYKICVKKNIKIIYEVRDIHKILIDKQKGLKKFVQHRLIKNETKALKQVERIIVTSNKFYERFYFNRIDKEKVIYIPNIPDLNAFKNYKRKDHNNAFTVGFIGKLRYKDQIINLINTCEKTDTCLFLAGSIENGEIEKYIKEKNIQVFGKYSYVKDISLLYSSIDCVFSVYDSNQNNVTIALPNKLYEAVYCELPIIVSKNTYVGEIVEKYGVGLAVDSTDELELIDAINKLKSDKLFYERIVENCRKIKTILLNNEGECLLKDLIVNG